MNLPKAHGLILGLALLALPALGEAPATQDGSDVYLGEVAVRSTLNGYVIAVEGEWGSRNFFFRCLESVESLAEVDGSGKILYSPRELLVSLPESRTLLRLAVPDGGGEKREMKGALQPLAQDQRALLVARYEAERWIENVEGFELAIVSSSRPGLGVHDLLRHGAEDLTAVVTRARGLPGEPGLEILSEPYFDPSPPDDPSGGGSSCTAGGPGSDSCSRTCGGTGDSCTVNCSSFMSYSCCYCSGGVAYCVCRLSI